MKKEKAQLLQRQQSMKSTRKKKRVGKILHLKGLKRKIPNKWRVNWPAHISFIRHAFKIQLRLQRFGEGGKRKPLLLLFAFLIWLDGFVLKIWLDVSDFTAWIWKEKNWKWMMLSSRTFQRKSCQNVLESQFRETFGGQLLLDKLFLLHDAHTTIF